MILHQKVYLYRIKISFQIVYKLFVFNILIEKKIEFIIVQNSKKRRYFVITFTRNEIIGKIKSRPKDSYYSKICLLLFPFPSPKI